MSRGASLSIDRKSMFDTKSVISYVDNIEKSSNNIDSDDVSAVLIYLEFGMAFEKHQWNYS